MDAGDWINLATFLLALTTAGNNIFGEIKRNNADKARQVRFESASRELDLRANRLECAAEFAALNDRKTALTDLLNEIESLVKIPPNIRNPLESNPIHLNNCKIIRKANTHFVGFCNSLDHFCCKIMDGTYTCEEYINKEVASPLCHLIALKEGLETEFRRLFRDYHVTDYRPIDNNRLRNIQLFKNKYNATDRRG